MNPQLLNYEPMLKDSIKHFLSLYENGGSDFSAFESIFFRLIQTMLDPPLEITWFYSAVTFHSSKLGPKNDPSTRILVASDLLNLLISCSNLSSASKKIALLAPVVYELYNFLYDFSKHGFSLRMEVGDLVEKMVSYIMVYCGVDDYANGIVDIDKSVLCFEDLVRVWTVDRDGGNCTQREDLRVFFPVFSDVVWNQMNARCGIGKLAGIVLYEVFLLRLCLKFGLGGSREELLKDAQNLAVQTIKGFQNFYFLEMILNMLLEPSLPVSTLLGSEDAIFLQKALYDAVILIDHSYLQPHTCIQSVDGYSRNLALVWSLVADNAICLARATCDQARAISYVNAFSGSRLVTELIKRITVQAGMQDENSRPSTPKALIKWLFVLEDQGFKVFDHKTSSLRARAVTCSTRMDGEFPEIKPDEKNLKQNMLVCPENVCNKDKKMDGLSNKGLPASVGTRNPRIDGCRKRKDGLNDIRESRVKHVKYDFLGSSFSEKLMPFSNDDRMYCGNEVKNLASDDDMEVLG
ncbi:Hypothetical predicted protein [Olea europaea subsp. europaea]|uniref:Uncharacterized protein n=1 Tax=Olea europaea subsp. europaea TaxID=158383 RepID=A0A8S0RCJ6_OLEEU|nr:Hypothetical predicted protein [Olea europaea subsp. europaea]